MKKRLVLIFVLIIVFYLTPINTFASSISKMTSHRPDYLEIELFSSFGHKTIRIDYDRTDFGGPKMPPIYFKAVENGFTTFRATCLGDVNIAWLDANGKVVQVAGTRLELGYDNKSCTGKGITQTSPTQDSGSDTPPSSDNGSGGGNDGSGGNNGGGDDGSGGGNDGGGSGGNNNDGGSGGGNDGSGGNNGGGDDGSGGGNDGGGSGGNNGGCGACEILKCPGWKEHMGKIDEIIGKIPAAPDWDKVADKFRDSIVPKLISDLGDLLGTAPAKPNPPPIPSGVDDHGFTNKKPTGQEAPGLGDTDFSTIKDKAPVIKEKPDDSDGFNILNPVENLPSQGEFLEHIPKDVDSEAPMPKDGGGKAPIPDDGGGKAPIPGDKGGTAPIPNDGGGTAPLPNDNSGNAPIPGGGGGNAPIPGGNGGNAPNPGDWGGGVPIPGRTIKHSD